MSTTNGKAAAPVSPFAGRRIFNYQRPYSAQWIFHPALREGQFNARYDVPAMLQDYAVAIGLNTIYGPLANAQFEVRANSKEIKTFVENTIYRFWHHDLMRCLRSYIPYGTVAAETMFEKDADSGLWKFAGLNDFHIFDVQPWKKGRHMTKMRVQSAGMGMGAGFQEENLPDWNVVEHPKIFWCAHATQHGNLQGHSTLAASFSSWMEKSGSHGARSNRKLWAFSNSFRGCIVKYPIGSTLRADGTTRIDNRDIAQECAENYSTGGVSYMPSGVDPETKVPLWEIIDPKLNGDIKQLMEYPKELDREIWMGMGIPDEVLHAPETGGIGPVSRMGPYSIFISIEDARILEIITAFDVGPSGYTTRNEQAGGVIRPLVIENFGPKARYEIRPISLAPKPAEPGAGGSPQSAPAAATTPPPDQGGGMPPESGELRGASGEKGSPNSPARNSPLTPRNSQTPVQLSSAAFSVELPDDEVMAIWRGDVSLSTTWNEELHHRGQPNNRGEFGPGRSGNAAQGGGAAAPQAPAKPAPAKAPGLVSTIGDGMGVASDVYHVVHEAGSEAFHSLPEPIQMAVCKAVSVAFTGWTASQNLAERISREKGSTPEEAAKTRSVLAAWDIVAFKPTAIATASLGPAIAAATWIIPPVTGAYLLHAAVRHPICTFRAALGFVKDAAAGVKELHDKHTVTLSVAPAAPAAPSAPQMLLLAALQKHRFDDWYSAILHAAIQETRDAAKAVQVADAVFAKHPKDQSKPQADDADKLFAGKGAALSATWNEAEHKRGQPENKGEFGPGGNKAQGGGAAAKPTAAPPAAQAPAPPAKAPDLDASVEAHKMGIVLPVAHPIQHEAKATPPPPGGYEPDPAADGNGDGVADAAIVGVPAMEVPPPPPMPRLNNLTEHERTVERSFAAAYEANPTKLASDFYALTQHMTKPGDPPTFGTDDAKVLTDAWSVADLNQRAQNRATLNTPLHQTANAIAKRAFLMHLDMLQHGDELLVTCGGCGSGKGFALKMIPKAKEIKGRCKAVWDSAGDQSATENPWIQAEAEKRGLKVNYLYVHADPKVQWADPERGVIKRAGDPADGRMVGARVFADSYANGARNMQAFVDHHRNNPHASFTFLQNAGPKPIELPGIPQESLQINAKELAAFAADAVNKSSAPAHVKRGALMDLRIWGDQSGTKPTQSATQPSATA